MVISKGNIAIGPSDIPGRKKPSLVVMEMTEKDGVIVTPFATFRSRADADRFMDILAKFVGAREVKEDG